MNGNFNLRNAISSEIFFKEDVNKYCSRHGRFQFPRPARRGEGQGRGVHSFVTTTLQLQCYDACKIFFTEPLNQPRNANYMSHFPGYLLLACAVIVFTGCQHSLAPLTAWQQPLAANNPLIYAGVVLNAETAIQPPLPAVTARPGLLGVDSLASPKPQDKPLVPTIQKKRPESQTGQAADGLLDVFTTFTGH